MIEVYIQLQPLPGVRDIESWMGDDGLRVLSSQTILSSAPTISDSWQEDFLTGDVRLFFLPYFLFVLLVLVLPFHTSSLATALARSPTPRDVQP